MFRSNEEELILKKHRHTQLLNMFRKTLTSIAALKQLQLHAAATAHFYGDKFNFEITVFDGRNDNTSLTLYDFWEIERSQKLVDTFMKAIKTGDFEKVKSCDRA